MADIQITQNIQTIYTITDSAEFKDAIYSPIESPLTPNELADEMKKRYDHHLDAISGPDKTIEVSDVLDVLEGN